MTPEMEMVVMRSQIAGLKANLEAASRSEIAARQAAALWKRAAKRLYRIDKVFQSGDGGNECIG